MKKILILLFLMIFLSSCSIQENMNPEIFSDRFYKLIGNEISSENLRYENNREILFFKEKNGTDYIIEFNTDTMDNIKKICLACNDTSKADSMNYYFEKIINIFAPDENTDEIISNLLIDKWNYYSTQWFDYSSAVSDEGIFLSVESKKLSTQSDAELTLKQNDIIFR